MYYILCFIYLSSQNPKLQTLHLVTHLFNYTPMILTQNLDVFSKSHAVFSWGSVSGSTENTKFPLFWVPAPACSGDVPHPSLPSFSLFLRLNLEMLMDRQLTLPGR